MRPRLGRHVRLRVDRVSGKPLLLAPERGLFLNTSAAEIVELCDGTRSRDEIVACLLDAHADADAATIGADVDELLAALSERALLERG